MSDFQRKQAALDNKRKSENDNSTGEQRKKLQRVGEMIVHKVPYPASVNAVLSNYEGSSAGTKPFLLGIELFALKTLSVELML